MSSDQPTRDPEELEAGGVLAHAQLPASTTVGAVQITVADLDRSLEYYTRTIGLALLRRDTDSASLGAGARVLLELVAERRARPAPGHTGLYHFALLVPERADLAGWLAHAARDHVRLTGLSDHFVSEALYMSDPDQHGIEIYWDRPRELWEGRVSERMTTLPLDVNDLLGVLADPATAPFDRLPEATVIGHVHLKVARIPETIGFYRDVLGFALMAQLGPQAAFLSVGGYHHRVGANTWESAGASPPPPGSATLRHTTIVLPGSGARDRVLARLEASGQAPHQTDTDNVMVSDPSGNLLALALAG